MKNIYLQHIVMTFGNNPLSFPRPRTDHGLLCKKVKGIQRNRHKKIRYEDFIQVAICREPARLISTARFARKTFKIFLVQGKKKILGRFTTKRLIDSRFRQKSSFFSFPLEWKERLNF